ncbi:hypothetical protein PE066_17855 [Ramlibacter tataouinensis]|uniref:hypothetical protein n=1 Tax=Ramlibacter tataouinensis TaxID=94132 RepID=UPI0022F3E787|nr:hypothetical protein [Ramlibacter tataouinensis]WBY01305.1 hypothetical protein PE066_17855 [Ramlibacter tataouinensis]
MIFALCVAERRLLVFEAEVAAIAHAEDSDGTAWQFFDAAGLPLEVVTAGEHPRCFFVAPDTLYLRAADRQAGLAQRLHEVAAVQGPAPLDSVQGVRDWLRRSKA